jgi:glycosyltransferase involved in cell wall biosynthesis
VNRLLKEISHKLGFEIKRLDQRVVSLKPENGSLGNVLLSYIVDPFYLINKGKPIPNNHPNFWESFQMAQTYLEMGYRVDVINYDNNSFIPRKDYSIFVDPRWNLERLEPLLSKDCVKIFHVDIAHTTYYSAAELRRLLELQKRRGITLRTRRVEPTNWGIEHADCATVLGNDFTMGTFRYANKPMYYIPVISLGLYPWPEEKDFEACRKCFLWLGSRALVHKGLDLVLEAFAKMPDFHLTVCGPIQNEPDFVRAFHKELYETPNIETIGWIDVKSPEFIQIANSCVGFVYASCAEGQSSSVVTSLNAALIPIISYECGVDVNDFGTILSKCSIDEIKQSVENISRLAVDKLRLMARKAWEYGRTNHSKENYAKVYKEVVEKIHAKYSKRLA